MPAVEDALRQIAHIDGLVGASLVEVGTGSVLATVTQGDALDPQIAAAGATDVVQAMQLMTAGLGLGDDLEDVIVTLTSRYHIIRMLGGSGAGRLFLVVSLDRSRTNLAMAHREIREFDAGLVA